MYVHVADGIAVKNFPCGSSLPTKAISVPHVCGCSGQLPVNVPAIFTLSPDRSYSTEHTETSHS